MSISAAIQQGLRVARRNRTAVWALFFVNLALAALAALPIYHGILDFTGHSLIGRALAAGFPVDWFTDFNFNRPGVLERYGETIWWFGVVALPVNAIFAGGAIAGLRQPAPLGDFFHEARRYAWRMLRLMVLGLICYWIVFLIFKSGLGNLAVWWTRNWLADRPVFWVQLIAGVLLLLGIGFVNLVLDYARVRLVMEDRFSAVESFLASLGFSFRHLGSAIAVYAFPSLCGLALIGIYRLVTPWHLINSAIGSSGPRWLEPLAIGLLFLGQQFVMFLRYWLRIATWACEWSYYADSR